MSKAILVARLLLGLVFFVFGLNGFFQFIPVPPMEGPSADFMMALMATGYMLPLIKAVEVVGGALLLAGRFVPLALILLAPIVVNIFAFHAMLDPAGLGMAAVVAALQVFLAWAYRKHFAGVLKVWGQVH